MAPWLGLLSATFNRAKPSRLPPCHRPLERFSNHNKSPTSSPIFKNQKNKPQTVTPKTPGFSFTQQKDRVTLRLDGRKITEYLLDHPQLTRRAFINVHTHTGIQVTRNYPPMPNDGGDHPVMHPGIWMSFGHLDGQDYWRLKAKVLQ